MIVSRLLGLLWMGLDPTVRARVRLWMRGRFVNLRWRRFRHAAWRRRPDFITVDYSLILLTDHESAASGRLFDECVGVRSSVTRAGELESGRVPALSWRIVRRASVRSDAPLFIASGTGHLSALPLASRRLHAAIKRGVYDKGPLTIGVRSDCLALKPAKSDVMLASGIFLGGFAPAAIFHTMVERLPILAFIQYLPESTHDFPLLVPQEALKYCQIVEAIQTLAPERQIYALKRGANYTIDRLAWVDEPAFWRPANNIYLSHTVALKSYRDFVLNDLGTNNQASVHDRIFIERGPRSRAANEEELIDAAREWGFVPWRPEESSFREQVATWHGARYVIGDTGAAWGGLLFASHGLGGLIHTFSSQLLGWPGLARISGSHLRTLRAAEGGVVPIPAFRDGVAQMTASLRPTNEP